MELKLSGAEKQRLAIARAILKNPKIPLLMKQQMPWMLNLNALSKLQW